MGNLPQEVLSRLDLLAEKLGVASEYIWEILIKQSSINFYIALCTLILCVILEIIAARITAKSEEGLWGDTPAYFICCLFPGIGIFASLGAIITNVGYFINPEYYALTKIMEIIK
jgi:hypothetical protein